MLKEFCKNEIDQKSELASYTEGSFVNTFFWRRAAGLIFGGENDIILRILCLKRLLSCYFYRFAALFC